MAGGVGDAGGGEITERGGDGPARREKVIGDREAKRHGRGLTGRGGGIEFEVLAGKIELALKCEGPSVALGGHEVPSVESADIQIAGDGDGGERAIEVGVGGDQAVDAGIVAGEEGDDFGQIARFQLNAEVEAAFAVRRRVKKAAGGEVAESLRAAVGAGGRSGEADADGAGAGGVDVDVGVAEIEDRLGIGEFKVEAAGADLNVGDAIERGGGSGQGGWAREKRLDIPRAGGGFHQVHVGVGEAEG